MYVAKLAIGFLLLGALFYTLEYLFPAIRSKPLWRRDGWLDLAYWFFTPVVTRTISRSVAIAAVIATAIVLGRELGPELFTQGFGPIARQPRWLIVVEMLLIGDFAGYWAHRWLHRRRLWRFHAIHHSSPQVDWLSSVRVHPINDIVMRAAQAIPLAFLGLLLLLRALF